MILAANQTITDGWTQFNKVAVAIPQFAEAGVSWGLAIGVLGIGLIGAVAAASILLHFLLS